MQRDGNAASGTLFGVQYLRLFAASLVVMHHSWLAIPFVGKGDLGVTFVGGGTGVDVFFVISGFIMIYITMGRDRSALHFLRDRITRIAPPYWIMTLLIALVMIVSPSSFRTGRFDPMMLIASLLFIPYPSPTNGTPAALLLVGWTLNCEMFFYLLFTLSLVLFRHSRARVLAIFAAFVLFSAMRPLVTPQSNVLLQFLTSTIQLEFAFGMAIALLVPRLPKARPIALGFLILALVVFIHSLGFYRSTVDQDRFLVWGIPSALLVAGVVWCDRSGLIGKNRVLLFLGNESYALYLVHLLPVGLVRAVWPRISHGHISDAVLIAVCLIASFAAASAFYVIVEKPLLMASRKLADRIERSGKVASPAAI